MSEATYGAAARFAAECLRRDGSLFTPGRRVWAQEAIQAFFGRLMLYETTGEDFMTKLMRQLEGLDPAAVQVAAEALFVHLLAEDDTSGGVKRQRVQAVLDVLPEDLAIPHDLDPAFERGIARIGVRKSKRDQELRFLLQFALDVKELPEGERERVLADPRALHEFVDRVERHNATYQVEALFHLLFPDAYEPVVSLGKKREIVAAFAEYVDDPLAPLDEQVSAIRRALEHEHGDGFGFYDPDVLARWQPSGHRAEPTRGAWLVRGAHNQSVDARGENMLPRWFDEGFVSIGWPNPVRFAFDASTEEIRSALDAAYRGAISQGEIIRGSGIIARFLSIGDGDYVVTPDGDKIYVARATGDTYWADEDASTLRQNVEWLNGDEPASRAVLRERAPELWTSLRTLLTVSDLGRHAAAVAMLVGEEADSVGQQPPVGGGVSGRLLPSVRRDLADSLHLPTPWLQEIVDLLNEKKQVIFYGPPGTGKTFVAQALGRHVEEAGGAYRLVQFHPAYSYEDFFEGYRPRPGDGGSLAFDLREGPLRLLAREAAANLGKPYLLIVDELNRGNLPKIFGELYFLLEYRDRGITLQYRPGEEFRLPENLLLIGTMNTADRSIALVDSALRRRFYFQPFLPREQPVRDVLRRWLASEGYDLEPARLLDALNEALHEATGDDEAAIGPSYLIAPAGPPRLDHVWRHAIMPLLEERFYGARRRGELESEFGLAALRRRLTGEAEDEEPEAE